MARVESAADKQETTDLRITRSGATMTIEINRPDENNRLTLDAFNRLEQLTRELARDDTINVVVFTGSGSDFFSMGILNPTVRASLSKREIIDIVLFGHHVFNAIDALPQITIAALNGAALAGAVELALACDIRVAAEHSTFACPEASWASYPGCGAPYRLASAIGRARAIEIICTAREVKSIEMERIGFTQFVYSAAQFQSETSKLSSRIAAMGPLATRDTKRILRVREEPGLAAASELSDALRHEIEWSEDVQEALAAHREGRSPQYTGR